MKERDSYRKIFTDKEKENKSENTEYCSTMLQFTGIYEKMCGFPFKGGEDVEILIVDDGSKDDTLKIARDYEEKYPTIVKAIHQENKGHGGAVNTGLAHATGLYFKVVDSDDWLNEEALKKALEVLKLCVRGPKTLDLLICNYVYEKWEQRERP